MNVCSLIVCLLFVNQAASVESNNDNNFSINVTKRIPLSGKSEKSDVARKRIKRIIGGSLVYNLGDWPWIGAVGYKNNDGFEWKCACTLISERYALTAAHCIYSYPNVVRFGIINLDDANKDFTKNIRIIDLIYHENHTVINDAPLNDIALLQLEKDKIKFNEFLRPADLPKSEEFINGSTDNVGMYAAGYGHYSFVNDFQKNRSLDLREIYIPVIDNMECNRKYENSTCDHMNVDIHDTMMCAGTREKNICLGDSGGPLIWRRHDGNYLMGIISFGIDCGATDKPGVFTRVTEYITWIDENIKLLDMSEAISTVQPCIPVEITLTIDDDYRGPLTWKRYNGTYLKDIISFGIKYIATDKPSVFTRVTEYIPWINDYAYEMLNSMETITQYDIESAITVPSCKPVKITVDFDVRSWMEKIFHFDP